MSQTLDERNVILHGDLIIKGLENLTIQKLVVCQEINQHASLEVSAILREEDKEEYRKLLYLSSPIQVLAEGKVIFSGVLTDSQLDEMGNVNNLNLTSLSHTILMDLHPKSCSFQNIKMSYTNLVEAVVKKYEGGGCIDRASNGTALGQPIIQYLETDWSFCKRMASHFNSCLIPNVNGEGPRFFFGSPDIDKGILEAFNVKTHKDFHKYSILKQTITDIMELDFTVFEVEVKDIYDLGDKVIYNGISCYISKSRYQYEKGIIKNIVYLSQKRGMSTQRIPNTNIAGVALFAKVIAVARDNVKIHLEIDETQDIDSAYWYPYESVYASGGEIGFYCMPEIGDAVKLYHFDENELNASVTDAVKHHNPTENPDSLDPQHPMANPNIKYLRTPFNKEICLRPGGIDVISSRATSMTLNDNGTVSLASGDKISLVAGNQIEIRSKKINIESTENLKLGSSGSSIELGDNVEIKGSKIDIS